MLHFLENNIYLTYELSNDIVDEAWTTGFPACVDDEDATGIYEGVKLHKFDFATELQPNPKFLFGKKNIMLNRREMVGFMLSWYDACVQRNAISNCVDLAEWATDYFNCYSLMYSHIQNFTYEGALTYYEALAVHNLDSLDVLQKSRDDVHKYISGMERINPIPEVSWMLADYLKNNKKSVWKNYLTEYIRHNIRGIRYKRAIGNRAWEGYGFNINIRLEEDMTIDDVDFSNEQAVYYFDNPFELDFHTNYMYIKQHCVVDE